jgi:AI-2 transport protein TqsA
MKSPTTDPSEGHADSGVQTACLLVLAFVAAGVAMYLLRPVLVPFLLALFFSYCLGAIIDGLVRRLHIPSILAILVTAVAGLAILVLVGVLVGTTVARMSDQMKGYGDQVGDLTDRVAQYVPLERLGLHRDTATGGVLAIPEETVTAVTERALSELAGVVSNGALVLAFVVLLLFGGRKVATSHPGLLQEIAGHVQRYTLQMTVLSAMTGVLVGGVLWILGVPFALVFGFLAFLLNFIPTLGAIVATLLPLPIVLLTPGVSPAVQVLAIAIPAAIQIVVGNLIQPKLLGKSFGLHPVSILLALVFFGLIWGLVGAFLATPIAAILKIALERIPSTRFIAAILAGTYGEYEAPKADQA